MLTQSTSRETANVSHGLHLHSDVTVTIIVPRKSSKRNLQPNGTGETNRTTTLGYDNGFNNSPNTNSQRYFQSKEGVEIVELQNETLTRSWAYDHSTGCLGELIEYGIHTGFECHPDGNLSKVKPGQRVDKEITYTYEWGVLKNTVTKEYTVSRVINLDGTVASETRGGRTTVLSYDDAFRLTQIQPPGATNPIITEHNNVTGRTIVTKRGTSTVTTTLDGLGRPIKTATKTAIGQPDVLTRTSYDRDERLIYQSYSHLDMVDPVDIGTAITYDGLGRVKYRTNPDDSYVEHTYTAGTIAIRAANARVTTVTWQAFGNPKRTSNRDLNDPVNQNSIYTLQRPRRSDEPHPARRYWQELTYNASQRLTSETNPESGTVLYTAFDDAGVPRQVRRSRHYLRHHDDGNYRVKKVTADALTIPDVVTRHRL